MGGRTVAACTLIASASVAFGQRPVPHTIGPSVLPMGCSSQLHTACAGHSSFGPQPASGQSSAWPVAASALLPGLGQAMQGESRALGYLAIEAFAWTGYVWYASDSRRQRDGYRDLAARVARSSFSPVRPNGDFEYYERMAHYAEAGRFDVVAGGGIDPEPDPTTYNGMVWALARRTFWSDPAVAPDTASAEWKQSLAFYSTRAYDELFRWSWSGSPDEYSRFKGLIDQSNDANRRSIQALGVVIANHVLSAVDAYIVVRLRGRPATLGGGMSVEGRLPIASLARWRPVANVPHVTRRSHFRRPNGGPGELF